MSGTEVSRLLQILLKISSMRQVAISAVQILLRSTISSMVQNLNTHTTLRMHMAMLWTSQMQMVMLQNDACIVALRMPSKLSVMQKLISPFIITPLLHRSTSSAVLPYRWDTRPWAYHRPLHTWAEGVSDHSPPHRPWQNFPLLRLHHLCCTK